ncbi:hypothetical protein OH77DRAFT_1417530 [Trametes cingulata]|nr:hypothetical protein OH77DRAFT_1417530 [Trametes cingulata]
MSFETPGALRTIAASSFIALAPASPTWTCKLATLQYYKHDCRTRHTSAGSGIFSRVFRDIEVYDPYGVPHRQS